MQERLFISLIGMSNGGKSHWSKLLQKEGFERYCCDDLIEKKLGQELKALGYAGIQDVAKWMGQPFDSQYPERSRKYLDLEGEVVSEVLEKVKRSRDRRVVIDTTGSIIYLPEDILKKLSTKTRVVYLETPDSVKDEMYRAYLENPKSVIWGESFTKAPGETDMQALGSCYPKLLADRSGRYAKFAHVTLGFHDLRDPNFTVANFMSAIKTP